MKTVDKHDFGVRPKCIECGKDCQFVGKYRKDGSPIFRKYCGGCHMKRQAKKKGMTVSQWTNEFHPYKRYRKTYCENAKGKLAGWLGFKCTTKIVAPHLQLDTDHLDGNPYNNEPDNLHTLCKCCHAIKTNMFMDYSTKGRKKGKK
jgi:hypothetical protein